MTTKEAQSKIKKAGGTQAWYLFLDWMKGQTVGMNEDGTTDWYDYDVNRFIRYKCNPKNEPLVDVD